MPLSGPASQTCQGLEVPPFTNHTDGLTEAERRGQGRSWVQLLCAHSARPGTVTSVTQHPLHALRANIPPLLSGAEAWGKPAQWLQTWTLAWDDQLCV